MQIQILGSALRSTSYLPVFKTAKVVPHRDRYLYQASSILQSTLLDDAQQKCIS